jgi:hypothetical protein
MVPDQSRIRQVQRSCPKSRSTMLPPGHGKKRHTLAIENTNTLECRFLQNTTGDVPPQLTMFCSVVAAAADRSSFNIYIYGGYDGVSAESPPSDDVYILSIPSFTWIKAYSGKYAHGRSGHKCLQVYPDRMFVLGGVFKNDPTVCLDGGFVQVFNLNTLQFQETYSPQNWSNYSVPEAVTSRIGGT